MEQICVDGFDAKKAYKAKEKEGTPFFDDGREVDLLHFVYGRADIDDIRGSPRGVLKAIDDYARSKKYLMNIGEDKGRILSRLIADVKPKTMVELGGYIGYSTILFADAVREADGRLFSLERNPEFAAVIMSLVDLAGLSDVVKVLVGPSADSIKRLHSGGSLTRVDLMFLDHYKPAYTTDLKLCEHLQLIVPGSVLVADNVIYPGNPPYLEYVRSDVKSKKKKYEKGEINDDKSGFENRSRNQYQDREGEEKLSTEVKGDPNLIYESALTHSFEPTGEPV
ncbi:MAG: hypothetical protein Q9191_002547 [Dirinaria sp. TL-2023a]